MVNFAFGCEARVGKDTAAEYLIKKYGGVRMSFAQPIYDILAYAQEMCGFEKEKDRKFLQWVGTDWARDKDPNIWLKLVLQKIEVHNSMISEQNINNSIYITDTRFSNEISALKKKDFITIRIIRNIKPKLEGELSQHASEIELIDNQKWDEIIENNSSLDDFYKKLDQLYQKYQN